MTEIREMLQEANAQEFLALERSLAADTRKGVIAALEIARRRLTAQAAEEKRLSELYEFDRSLLKDDSQVVLGLDEVGRGSVAGPLAVGAVVLQLNSPVAFLNDSKQLSPERRKLVAAEIKESALAWTVCYVEPSDIDQCGMSISLRRAFSNALAQIEAAHVHAEVVLVDGNPLGIDPRERNIVKGDSQSASIAAASVVAKVERDKLMQKLDSDFPQYALSINKGYATAEHVEAIRKYGLSPIHRATFCHSFLQTSLF